MDRHLPPIKHPNCPTSGDFMDGMALPATWMWTHLAPGNLHQERNSTEFYRLTCYLSNHHLSSIWQHNTREGPLMKIFWKPWQNKKNMSRMTFVTSSTMRNFPSAKLLKYDSLSSILHFKKWAHMVTNLKWSSVADEIKYDLLAWISWRLMAQFIDFRQQPILTPPPFLLRCFR